MKQEKDQRVRVELHCHTSASLDSLVRVDKYLKRCKTLGINKIAITDHNAIEAAQAAKKLEPDSVIVGEEIQTSQGELLGYFMSHWVPPGLDPMETIDRLRNQGAVISIPHPFDPFRGKDWEPGMLEAIAPYVDALETFNARCFGNEPNLEAAAFARTKGLLETVGSDAHTVDEIGNATLVMPDFWDAETFKAALAEAQPITELAPVYTHFFSTFAKIVKKIRNASSR